VEECIDLGGSTSDGGHNFFIFMYSSKHSLHFCQRDILSKHSSRFGDLDFGFNHNGQMWKSVLMWVEAQVMGGIIFFICMYSEMGVFDD
jgi:hypothetical protein